MIMIYKLAYLLFATKPNLYKVSGMCVVCLYSMLLIHENALLQVE